MPAVNLKALFQSKYSRVLTAVLVLQGVLFYSASHGESITLPAPLTTFPMAVGSFQMTNEGVVEKETLDVLKADDTLSRSYGGPLGATHLFVAYFKTQRTGQSPHSPKNCLPGSGWTQNSSGDLDVSIPKMNETIRINKYIVSKGDDKSLVLYWYQSKRRVIANEYQAKFWLVADSVRLHRSDTSLVRVIVPIAGGHEDQALETGKAFVQSAYPLLRQFFPA